MIEYRKNCNTCKLAKSNKTFELALDNSTYFNPKSTSSVRSIAIQYNLPEKPLRNHLKKHHFITKEQKERKIEQSIMEKEDRKAIQKLVTHSDIRSEVMTRGLEQIKKGEIKLSARDVLTASKDQMNYEMQTKNTQLKMMEMMWHFASGESNESEKYDRQLIENETATSFDPTQTITNSN